MSARILVIEDNQANMDLMTYLLQAFGYRPLVAVDGEEGLAAIRSERPDLILCDIQIPKLDGYRVAHELKSDAELRSIPLVAVTAFAMVGDRDKMLATGFDGYIAKPINPETFVLEVEKFLPTPLRSIERAHLLIATPPTAPTVNLVRPRAKVLVVDDLPSKRYLVLSILQPSHYEVLEADSVDKALVIARQTQPDLIVTDLHMPEKSGFALVRELRADPQICGIPVLIHTASRGQKEHEEFEPSATCFFLHSPIDPQELLETVHNVLHAKGAN